MSLPGFHPLVSTWFEQTFGEPTPVQQRGWEAIRSGSHALIAAPTGSGKTLAAFLTAIDTLVRDGLTSPLADEIRVVYVSPLKALSADIHRNLAEPRRGIRQMAATLGQDAPKVTAAVRTGDSTQAERAAILKTPPHILVTTPESLYLLLTAAKSRELLRTVRTVIVDEIHAVIGTRRGAHLALSLERLEGLAAAPIQRIGLSATQRPIEEVGRFLVGNDPGRSPCTIVDEGHRRVLDLAMEIPRSPLDAVMAHEVWEEYYDRLAELIASHTTTLVFVNTRRMAERTARHLSERLGEDRVTAHHGSLAKETRLDAETRLKAGTLKALVATASLELGIDIGHVDLVCQIGSPRRIATFLQRVGRSGHTVIGTPKGRLLPLSRDDLVECAALLRAVRRGELDAVVTHDAPFDVLAQQVTAEVACGEAAEDDLYQLAGRAWPYRGLKRADFDAVTTMLAEGFATRRGRKAALVHRDEVHHVLRPRRGSRLTALTSGGAIPENADYRVVLEPEETYLGTLNEDFAIESHAGDIIQLGNSSWRITRVSSGTVRVADAHGAPPTIPFWLGEAPARSDELSSAVSDLRTELDRRLGDAPDPRAEGGVPPASNVPQAAAWLVSETGVCEGAAEQIAEYMASGQRALGAVPTQKTLVLERFFDEAGGMQLILHAPFGARINRAWTLALRKRFCRQFNFELQAAATDDALLLSLGPQHSFPLSDVFRYLHPATVRDILVQAVLDAPLFGTRWRWNANVSLAVPRSRGGSKVPPPLQRMQADDLMAAVFPDAAACLENIPGDREIPDHPLVLQTLRDCLEEAMDIDGVIRVLTDIHDGRLRLISRDTPEPSVFADEIVNAKPYQFVDDAPLEERRTHAVQTRRPVAPDTAHGVLDAAAIARVVDEERPDPRDADEMHDVLLTGGFVVEEDADATLLRELADRARAARFSLGAEGKRLWVAAERLPELLAVHPGASPEPPISPPASRLDRTWTREEALAALLRGRLTSSGPVTAPGLASLLDVTVADVEAALVDLEADGVVLRGVFTPGARTTEWCDRVLLARIHRYTLNRLRSEIAPVTPADFMRFLFRWQHVTPGSRLTGVDGLRAVIEQLDGIDLPARAWERDVLAPRLEHYEPAWLDALCLSGEVGWARLSPAPTQVVGATPIALFLREHADAWLALRPAPQEPPANAVLERLRSRGASFAHDLAAACGMNKEEVHHALAELVAAGLVSSDGSSGLRRFTGRSSGGHGRRPGAEGRWFALEPSQAVSREAAVETFAWTLLQRYGVVFRRLVHRDPAAPPWRELAGVYRRLEARGLIRGGRFVGGMAGEQFALVGAVERLREIRRSRPDGHLVTLCAADPLNLTGIVTPGDRVRAAPGNRVVYRDGVPLASMEGDMLRSLSPLEPSAAREAAAAAAGRSVPVTSGYVGRLT